MNNIKPIKTFTIAVFTVLLLGSCSTTKSSKGSASESQQTQIATNEDYSSRTIEQLIENTDLDAQGSADEDPLYGIKRPSTHKVPTVINEAVKKWIVYFTKQNPSWFQRALTRSEEYETNMKNILISNDVPE